LGIKNFFKKAMSTIIEGNAQHPDLSWYALDIPRTEYDYRSEVGTGLGSNVIMAPILWIMRTFPEAELVLKRKLKEGGTEAIFDHPFLELMETPNDAYGYEELISGLTLSYNIAGNAYIYKVRNSIGVVIQLWYLPHWMIQPVGADQDSTVYVSHYVYNPNGIEFKIDKDDIIHIRNGINPENTREGLSPLASTIREIFTDDEASNYSATMLRNMGVPGAIIAPKENISLGTKEIAEIKEKFKKSFSGDNRGEPLVMTGPTEITTLGIDPSKMGLSDTRNISEERVTACLGIPSAVIGFGSGLEATKVGATMTALIKLAWTGNIIPTQRMFSKTLQRQLLIDFELDKSIIVCYDNLNVAAMQEDKDAKVKRLSDGVTKGWAKVSDVRSAEGLAVEDSDQVYLRLLNVVEID
jgi:HK97 family phage portal protein